MNNMKLYCLFAIGLLVSALLTACGPGQVFGPTLTPTATITLTPTLTATVTVTFTPTSTVPPSATPTVLATDVPQGDRDGKSTATAIVIEAEDEFSGIAKEYAWIEEHYPGYDRGGQTVEFDGEKIYDRISITTAAGEKLDIYFDITSFYGKL